MKKIFLFLLTGIVVLLLLFLSIGMIKPTVSYQNSIIVNATPEEAFKTFMDTSTMKLWITGLTHIEFINGSMNERGSKWKLFFDRQGEKYEMTETMTAFEQNKRFAFILDNTMFKSEVDIRFTASPQGTIITADNLVRGNGIIIRSLLFFTVNYVSKEGQKMYEELKQLIEKTSTRA